MNPYQTALSNLDSDGPQYITSNTLDEVSHANFLNAYLKFRGAQPVDFDQFRTLPGSTATGSSGIKRLTNLMNLTVDTSWYTRYRSATNPDFGATFPQAITLKDVTAIPRTTAELNDPNGNHLHPIANVAAFHFGYIEQGGSSLYAIMSQMANDPEVLGVTLGIGGDEIAHFLEWVDFAGNGVQPNVAPFTDSVSGLTFPNFFSPLNPQIQPSLIFPVPCEFINASLPHVSIIRPLTDKFGGAVATINSFIADGLFPGPKPAVPRNADGDGDRSGRCAAVRNLASPSPHLILGCTTVDFDGDLKGEPSRHRRPRQTRTTFLCGVSQATLLGLVRALFCVDVVEVDQRCVRRAECC